MFTSSATLSELREALSVIERSSGAARDSLPFGLDALDGRLGDGGLRIDALHEFTGEGGGWGDDCAATLFMAAVAARCRGSVLWVMLSRDLFAPALYQAGLAPDRVLYAQARDDNEMLALMEEGLRSRALGAVVGEAKRVPTAATRRLQLSAEGGGTVAMLLKRPKREGEDAFALPSAAVTRWRIASAPSVPVPWGGLGRACWRAACVRQRGAEPFELIVEAPDETGRLALPAALVDRPAATGRAPARAAA